MPLIDDMLVGFEHEQAARCARCHRVGDFRCFGERPCECSRGRTFPPTAARTDACYGRRSRQEFPDRQRRYCYGCSAYSLSPRLYPETLSWALKDVLKRADIPEARLEVRSGDWRIPRGLSHGIPR